MVASTPAPVRASASTLPLYFEAASGKTDGCAEFIARTHNGLFRLSSTGACVTLRELDMPTNVAPSPLEEHNDHGSTYSSMQVQFLGANREARISGSDKLAAKVNHLVGNDPANWKRGVSIFSKVSVDELYPGIGLVYYGNERQLEYDFTVAPGADPDAIAFRVTGADRVWIGGQGDLMVKLGGQELRQHRPVIYQMNDGKRKSVKGGYRLREDGAVTFQISSYNHELPLVIDPILSYSGFLGGMGLDLVRAISLDSSANVYVCGDTMSGDLDSANSYQPAYLGGYPTAGGDAFVAKFDSTGSTLIFLTYLGGSGNDGAAGIAVDQAGNVYVTGFSDSTDFPVTKPVFGTVAFTPNLNYFNLHAYHAFVSKLSSDGTDLIYSGGFGGTGSTDATLGFGIAVGQDGAAYVTGYTLATLNLFSGPALQSVNKGKSDAFVVKIAPDGQSVVYWTFLGGSLDDHGQSIAVDSLGRACVTGFTVSTNFPVTTNSFQPASPPVYPIVQSFVSVLETNGQSLVGSTFLSGFGNSFGFHVAVDGSGNVYVTGSETGSGFPVTPSGINPGGVYASTDAAANWAPRGLGLPHNQVGAIAIDPSNPFTLYASTGRGIAKSIDNGLTWNSSLTSFGQFSTIVVDPTNSTTIYAGGSDLRKSTNSGATWTTNRSGLTSVRFPSTNLTIARLVIDPVNPAILYGATVTGVYKTSNRATNWFGSSSGLGSVNVRDLVIDPSNHTNIYAAISSGVYRSTNGGGYWYRFNQPLTNVFSVFGTTNLFKPTTNAYTPSALAFDPAARTLYVGTDQGAVFKSAYNETNWTPASGSFTNGLIFGSAITAMAFDPNSATVYAGGVRSGLFTSVDGGTNWIDATNGLPGLPITSVAVSPVNSSNVFLGTYASLGGTDAYLTKFNPTLDSVIYSATFGGSGFDQAFGVALDAATNAYVVGTTASFDFPTYQTVGYPNSFLRGPSDAFVTAVTADGSAYLYSTYLGGSGNENGYAIAADASGNAYVAGQTFSADFPTVPPNQTTLNGSSDGFLARIQLVANANVTVAVVSDPTNAALVVDGVATNSPVINIWPANSFHIVSAIQSIGTNVQYAWNSWSDGGPIAHAILATNDAVYTASFRTQYFLTMLTTNLSFNDFALTNLAPSATNSGAVIPLSGWYDADTNLLMAAIPPFGGGFSNWVGFGDGSISGTVNPTNLIMTGPITNIAMFTGSLTNILRVVTNGNGTVSPNYNGSKLNLGGLYSVTALPGKGYVFSNWVVGVTVSNTPKLNFRMTNGLVLQANFAPSPFTNFSGTYQGLFYNSNIMSAANSGLGTAAIANSGLATMTLTSAGYLSGSLRFANVIYSFTSQLTANGSASISISRSGRPPLTIALQVDLTGGEVITGFVNDGITTAELNAYLGVYSATNPAPQAGVKYTLILPGGTHSVAEPGGDGYGTVSVDVSGNITFSGTLSDAFPVSQRVIMSRNGQWPFFLSLYSGAGSMLGWLQFTNAPDDDITGTFNWFRNAAQNTNLYMGGFIIQNEAAGSVYAFTNGVLPGLGTNTTRLVLSNGKLVTPITNYFTINAQNQIVTTNNLRLSFTTSSGLFSGSSSGHSFTGALHQKRTAGAGFFWNTQAGRVRIESD